jgi:hypothetical protein
LADFRLADYSRADFFAAEQKLLFVYDLQCEEMILKNEMK